MASCFVLECYDTKATWGWCWTYLLMAVADNKYLLQREVNWRALLQRRCVERRQPVRQDNGRVIYIYHVDYVVSLHKQGTTYVNKDASKNVFRWRLSWDSVGDRCINAKATVQFCLCGVIIWQHKECWGSIDGGGMGTTKAMPTWLHKPTPSQPRRLKASRSDLVVIACHGLKISLSGNEAAVFLPLDLPLKNLSTAASHKDSRIHPKWGGKVHNGLLLLCLLSHKWESLCYPRNAKSNQLICTSVGHKVLHFTQFRRHIFS